MGLRAAEHTPGIAATVLGRLGSGTQKSLNTFDARSLHNRRSR